MRNRLFSLCPYFAMFPEEFVARNLESFTKKGDYVFDPFCGRGTTILQSLLMDRNAAGTDINAVAYCISGAKSRVPPIASVMRRIDELQRSFKSSEDGARAIARELPRFFRHAYHPDTLSPLLFLRRVLKWRDDDVDRFIAALVLGALHGEKDKSESYFSNQMPRTISTKPAYSVRYWRHHGLRAPRRDVFKLLREKVWYRFCTEIPSMTGSVSMADARDAADIFRGLLGRVRAVITSPPYLDVTRYEEDQWLRLWFLGQSSEPTYRAHSDDRHSSEERYWEFLSEAWEGIAPLMASRSILVCRLGAKDISRRDLTDSLEETVLSVFPRAFMTCPPKVSKLRKRQTNTFQPKAKGCFFEVDFVFRLN